MEQGCGTTQTDDEIENNNNNVEHAVIMLLVSKHLTMNYKHRSWNCAKWHFFPLQYKQQVACQLRLKTKEMQKVQAQAGMNL